jgi:hypothetical protein
MYIIDTLRAISGHGWVRACGDRARHGKNLKRVVSCQPAGPEAKPGHCWVTLTRAMPCYWPARPFVSGRLEACFISQKKTLSVSVSDQFDSSDQIQQKY